MKTDMPLVRVKAAPEWNPNIKGLVGTVVEIYPMHGKPYAQVMLPVQHNEEGETPYLYHFSLESFDLLAPVNRAGREMLAAAVQLAEEEDARPDYFLADLL